MTLSVGWDARARDIWSVVTGITSSQCPVYSRPRLPGWVMLGSLSFWVISHWQHVVVQTSIQNIVCQLARTWNVSCRGEQSLDSILNNGVVMTRVWHELISPIHLRSPMTQVGPGARLTDVSIMPGWPEWVREIRVNHPTDRPIFTKHNIRARGAEGKTQRQSWIKTH